MDQGQILPPRRSEIYLRQQQQALNQQLASLQLYNNRVAERNDNRTAPSRMPRRENANQLRALATWFINYAEIFNPDHPFYAQGAMQAVVGLKKLACSNDGTQPKSKQQPVLSVTSPLEDHLIAELCKLEDMDSYIEACKRYRDGIEEGWTDQQLISMVAGIKARVTAEDRKAHAMWEFSDTTWVNYL